MKKLAYRWTSGMKPLRISYRMQDCMYKISPIRLPALTQGIDLQCWPSLCPCRSSCYSRSFYFCFVLTWQATALYQQPSVLLKHPGAFTLACGGTISCVGRLISETLHSVMNTVGTVSGFSTSTVPVVLWRTGVINSMVLIIPGGVDLMFRM